MTLSIEMRSDGDIRSSSLPGGTLIRALLDRRLMGLADMGGSSACIGARWSDIVSEHIDSLVGTEVSIPGGGRHRIEQVIRLDAMPHLAHAASRRSLQNPDFVFLGSSEGGLTLQAADAKFSIETARSKQVSVEVLTALEEVGGLYTDLLGQWHGAGTVVPGLFFAPASALTTFVLSGGRGITRSTVKPDEVVLLDVDAAELAGPIPGLESRRIMAELDGLADLAETEILLGLYYTRLSSAAGASWYDMYRPLFGPPPIAGPDFDAVRQEVAERSRFARSGYQLVTTWSMDAENVRADRATLNQAAGLPLPNRELREWTLADAAALGAEPPSLNRVRKELQRWVQQCLLEDIGVIEPAREDVAARANQIRSKVAEIAPGARSETSRIVRHLVEESDLAGRGNEEVVSE